MKVEMKGFLVTAKKKSINLTVDEARSLYDELDKVFGPKYRGPVYPWWNTVTNHLNQPPFYGQSPHDGTTIGTGNPPLVSDGVTSTTVTLKAVK